MIVFSCIKVLKCWIDCRYQPTSVKIKSVFFFFEKNVGTHTLEKKKEKNGGTSYTIRQFIYPYPIILFLVFLKKKEVMLMLVRLLVEKAYFLKLKYSNSVQKLTIFDSLYFL